MAATSLFLVTNTGFRTEAQFFEGFALRSKAYPVISGYRSLHLVAIPPLSFHTAAKTTRATVRTISPRCFLAPAYQRLAGPPSPSVKFIGSLASTSQRSRLFIHHCEP